MYNKADRKLYTATMQTSMNQGLVSHGTVCVNKQWVLRQAVLVLSLNCYLVESLQIRDGGFLFEEVGKPVLQVGNQHAKLCAPVPQVVDPQHVVSHPLQQPSNALPDNCRPV